MSLQSAYLQRGVVVRAAAALGLLVIAIFVLPHTAGADWITTFTSVAIYSVVALGFGILYGRVGLISLGQVALLTIGCWIGTRLAYATSLPFPLLLLLAGAITCAIGVLVGLPALRLSGLYLALITLMFAGATTIVLSVTDFPSGGGGFTGRSSTGALTTSTPPVRRPSWAVGDVAYYRYTVIVCAILFLLALVHVAAQAGPRLGDDSRERAGRARRRRQHHPLQAVGVRARLVRDRRRRLPARSPGRSAARDHLPDAGLAHARRDRADRRHLQPLGRGRRRHLQPGAAVPLPGAVGPEPELPADPLRRRPAAGPADRARRSRQPVPEGHGQSRAADLRRLPQADRARGGSRSDRGLRADRPLRGRDADRRCLRRLPGRHVRPDRPERRRQDDVLQRAERVRAARLRHDHRLRREPA